MLAAYEKRNKADRERKEVWDEEEEAGRRRGAGGEVVLRGTLSLAS